MRPAVNAPHLVALERAEAAFVNGKPAGRPDGPQPADAVAEAAARIGLTPCPS